MVASSDWILADSERTYLRIDVADADMSTRGVGHTDNSYPYNRESAPLVISECTPIAGWTADAV
jgi:hypothetical protein